MGRRKLLEQKGKERQEGDLSDFVVCLTRERYEPPDRYAANFPF